MDELDVRTSTIDLPGGQRLRVSSVSRPQGGGRDLVLEKMPGSAGARSLLEPDTGSRLVVSEDIAGDMMELVSEVTSG